MCTVAFVPLQGGGYLLGHNRDERRSRSRGRPPEHLRCGGRTVVAPRDPDGGGTWIGVHDGGATSCVLNATESRPERLPPEPTSRGLILWEMLHLDGADSIGNRLNELRGELRKVRSFHLVVAQPSRDGRPAVSVRFRWDGNTLERDDHEGPRLYVSSSLDQTGAEEARASSWARLRERHGEIDARVLREWLASHEPERGPLSVCMHRPEAKTVSRTLVTVTANEIELSYLEGSPCTPTAPDLRFRIR
jgi:uncharacterized protein with NRDE domain